MSFIEVRLLTELGHVKVTRALERTSRKEYLMPQLPKRDQRAVYFSANIKPQVETIQIPFDD